MELFSIRIRRTFQLVSTLISYAGINLRRFNVRMPQHFRHRFNRHAFSQSSGRSKRVTSCVGQNPQSNHQQTSNNKT